MKSLPTHKFAYTNCKVTNITEYGTDGTKGSTTSTGGKVTVDSSAATEEEGYYQYLGITSLKVENPTSEDNTAFFTGFALMITHWVTNISYQNVKVGRAGVSFKINGTAKSNSVPLSNENRTFGIALNIYYNNSSTPEFHYQNFSADTYAYQQVSLSVTPEKTNEIVNYIAFAFVYGYNENEMTVDNAEVNISPIIQSSKDSKNETSEKEAVDEEVLSESIDKSKPYMQTSSEYDSTGNYVTSETNEQGSTTKYSYDANGNPLTYRDGMSMTWKNGRQLTTLTNGDTSISYGYDSDSVRTTKTVNGVKYTYAYLNGQLLYETHGDAKFYYSYDANGILYNVRYTLTDGGTEYSYYYTHNSRGDIVGIYNGAGELKAHYEYDAWGNVISITDNNGNVITNPNHIGNLNPFRYRGYYQDTETGLYYLMSRYYDAVTHRFINADGYFQSGGSILDANTFAYCGNNPVNLSDPNGEHSCGAPTCPKCDSTRRAFLQTEKGIKLYNKCHGTNYYGVNDKGDFIKYKQSSGSTGATHAVSTINSGLSTAAGAVAKAPKPFLAALKFNAALSAPFSIFSISVDTAVNFSNPLLTDSQKGLLFGFDILMAGVGILASTCFPGIGGIVCSVVASLVTTSLSTYWSNKWSSENERKWCGV